jgi:hypothetical protein
LLWFLTGQSRIRRTNARGRFESSERACAAGVDIAYDGPAFPDTERDMAATTKFEGFSRKSYDYVRADPKDLNTLSTQGGNYLFAARVGGSPVIVYAAETGSIRSTVANHPLWAEARDKHGAIFVFVHLNPNPALRRLEAHDLIRKHDPPMNPRSTVHET